MKNRIISLALTLSLCASLLVLPAHAKYDYNPDPSNGLAFYNGLLDVLGDKSEYLERLNGFAFPYVGEVTKEQLVACQKRYNSIFSARGDGLHFSGGYLFDVSFAKPYLDIENGIWRLIDDYSGEWIYDLAGEFAYVEAENWDGGSLTQTPTGESNGAQVPATPSISRNGFVRAEYADTSQVVLVTQDALSQLVTNLSAEGINGTMWETVINGTRFYVVTDAQHRSFYCNSLNQPFVAKVQPSATDIKYDYITNNDNSTTINDSQVIDVP